MDVVHRAASGWDLLIAEVLALRHVCQPVMPLYLPVIQPGPEDAGEHEQEQEDSDLPPFKSG